jgi:uncharacterized membrane protein
MSALKREDKVAQRLERLERRLDATIRVVDENETRLDMLEVAHPRRRPGPARVRDSVAPPIPVRPPTPVRPPIPVTPPVPSPEPRSPTPPATSFDDFLGGRALAWIGGIATLLGIVLLLGLAISHDWIGPVVRVLLAGAGSAALLTAGVWLHHRRGRTEAAVAMVGAATAGAYATLVVAADLYRLIPVPVAVVAAVVVGALATALAIRWAGRAIAVIGLIGALVSPVMVGASYDFVAIVLLAIAAACSMAVVLWRRWPWLAFATVLVCAPQWAVWMANGQSPGAELAVLIYFGSIGLAGAVFAQIRSSTEDRALGSALALALLNAAILGVAGRLVFGSTGSVAWLAGLAVVHAGVGLWRRPRIAIHPTLRRLLIAVAVVAADVALGLSLDGLALSAAWGASALGFAFLGRRIDQDGDRAWLTAAVGAHTGLVLVRALIALPPSHLSAGPEIVPLASVAILAATCIGCAHVAPARGESRIVLDALGLLAVGYLTAATVSGGALVAVWAAESVALAEISRRTSDRVTRYGALVFLAAAGVHATLVEAPPTALVSGVDNLGAAALALAAVAAAALRIGLGGERGHRAGQMLVASSGAVILYLASVAVISAFQPAPGTEAVIVLDLGVRQQGQVLLSALWGVVGIAGLIAGLRRDIAPLRTAALGLLLATVAKVFLYDLSTLTSIYRVVSFFVLGGLLLAGAFAYQRLRPPTTS